MAAVPLGFARVLALAGFAVLAVLLVLWQAWLAPPRLMPAALALVLLLAPLGVALPGMLRGRSYTHAWVSLLALGYFILAVDGFAAGVEPAWLPAATLTATLALFVGTIAYVRACGALRRARDPAQDAEQ